MLEAIEPKSVFSFSLSLLDESARGVTKAKLGWNLAYHCHHLPLDLTFLGS